MSDTEPDNDCDNDRLSLPLTQFVSDPDFEILGVMDVESDMVVVSDDSLERDLDALASTLHVNEALSTSECVRDLVNLLGESVISCECVPCVNDSVALPVCERSIVFLEGLLVTDILLS